MHKKKKGSIILKILSFLFTIYMALYIANMSGYYENKIRQDVFVTDEGIKEFENKVQNGEEIDISSFLNKDTPDYNSNFSRLGEAFTSSLETIVYKGSNILGSIIKSLF